MIRVLFPVAALALGLSACASAPDPERAVERAVLAHDVFCALSPEARAKLRARYTSGTVIVPCPDEAAK